MGSESLNENKVIGPDKLSAIILKKLAAELAIPFAKFLRRILSERRWPDAWRLHYLIPIYKKNSVYQPGNYRGIHLTSILSKVAERVAEWAGNVMRLNRPDKAAVSNADATGGPGQGERRSGMRQTGGTYFAGGPSTPFHQPQNQ